MPVIVMKAKYAYKNQTTMMDRPAMPDIMMQMLGRLAKLGESSAGELGQELWLKKDAWRGIPENTIATRYCRPAGKLLAEAERRGWVMSRFGRNRKLWRVTQNGLRAIATPGSL